MADGTITAAFPLTPLQEGMLYHTVRTPGVGVYHGQCTALLEGELVEAHFRRAWALAAERHPALRTFFAWEGRERPLQVVRAQVELPIELLDWSDQSPTAQEARWQSLLADDRRRGFDLVRAPLMRVVAARTGARRHRLLWSVHHALVDGWSGFLVLDEVVRDHEALVRGEAPSSRPRPSLDRFVGWLQAQDAQAAESFWRETLAGLPARGALPGGRAVGPGIPRPGDRATTELVLSVEQTRRLQADAARLRVTANTLLMGAWAMLLARHAESDDVTFGVTVSERPAEIDEVDRAVGLYLATVPVRARLTGEERVSDWLGALQLALSDARAHAAPGLASVQRWSGLPPGAPLFDTLLVFENFPPDVMHAHASSSDAGPRDSSALVVREASMSGPSDLPLVLLALPGERLTLSLIRDPSIVSAAAADRLLGQLATLLGELGREGTRPLSELSVLDAEERALLDRWSVSTTPAPPAVDVVARFEAHATEHGSTVALRTARAEMTYASLDEAADRLANRLLASGLGPGRLVGVLAERSPDLVVGMLGVLKAGAAYVPMDPETPAARLEQVAAAVDAVVASPALVGRVPSRLPIVPLDGSGDRRAARADTTIDPHAPAYVMHTSGSTGDPKGVVVERAQLAASTAARDAYYAEAPRSFLLLSSPAVDSSVAGLYWTLCTGGTLVLPPPRAEQDVDALARLVEQARVSHVLLVPSLHRTLLEHADPLRLASLRCVVVAGEACPVEVVRLHRRQLPGVELHNEYGPTEATVWATADELTRHADGPVTIGRPVPGARIYLLDARLRPVPVGVPGEICIGGAFVARGYLGQPEETARRFTADPHRPAGRLYRTGDRGRYLEDGRIEFLGRTDEQLKIRGFRVEPAEIERTLATHPGVREAAVALVRPGLPAEVDALTTALLERSDGDVERLLATVEARS